MNKKPYIVYINPNKRPRRDPVDLRGPFLAHIETGTQLGLAVVDAVTVWWIRFWLNATK